VLGHPSKPFGARLLPPMKQMGLCRAGSADRGTIMEVTTLKSKVLAAAVAGLGLLAAAPAAQAATAAPAACTPQPATGQPFAAWDDFGLYTLVSGAGFEGDLAGWTLNGAQVVEGNEPFQVGGEADHRALALNAGDSVTTAPICIDDTYPWFPFFARNTAGRKAKLKVEVLYTDTKGKLREEGTGDYATAKAGWLPTGSLGIDVDWAEVPGGALPVSFRFTADSTSSFLVDDLYVDPMARG
jgi:hypothetical protein